MLSSSYSLIQPSSFAPACYFTSPTNFIHYYQPPPSASAAAFISVYFTQRRQRQQQQKNFPRIFSTDSHQAQAETTSTSTPTPTATVTKVPISVYLTERLGFSLKQCVTTSDKFFRTRRHSRGTSGRKNPTDLIICENADKVISYFQDENECGFDLSQVIKIVTKYPAILTADVDKTIRPKIAKLQQVGFSASDDLAYLLGLNPYYYLHQDVSTAIEAFKEIMGNGEPQGMVKFFRRLTRHDAHISNLMPNVTMLENEFGIPRDKIKKFICRDPNVMMYKTESLRDLVVKIEDRWGITRDSGAILRALTVFGGFSDENINSKCQVYRSFGWSQSDIQSLVRGYPSCLSYSEARIKKLLDFYMNELDFEPAYLASRFSLLGLSLENRVLPRHRVLSILKEKGRIKADYQLYSGLVLTDKRFYDKFISPYDNIIPELREIFINGRVLSEGQMHMEASEIEPETLVLPNVG